MTLKEFVIATVKPDDYYADRFPGWNPHTKSQVPCPFHVDGTRPNLSISLRNGGARCHSSTCAKRLGNIVHFESAFTNRKESFVARKLYRQFVRPVVSGKTLEAYRDNLSTNGLVFLKLRREMGLSLASIKRFGLGLDPESNRITIPVYDRFVQCVNIRFYRLPSERLKTNEHKIYNLTGHGGCDLFPWPAALEYDASARLYIMASEKEAMLAIQDGYCAVASTAGEDKWELSWSDMFRDRDVFLVLDIDKGGVAAAARITPLISEIARSVTNVVLPFKTKRADRKDYADWRLKEKHGPEELGLLSRRTKKPPVKLRATVLSVAGNKVTSTPTKNEYPELPEFASEEMQNIASISSRLDLLNKRIRTQGIVAAKSPNTYSIPWKFRVSIRNRADFEYELPMSRELLRFIRTTDTQILQSLQKMIGSASAEITPIAYLTATEIEIIPTAVVDQEVPYTVQRCFYFGERIESNVPYYMEIIPTSEIRSQETIGIITQIEAMSKTIDKFDFTPENIADLSFFQPTEGEDVWDKLVGLSNMVTHTYTRVYNRMDWTIAALLTWTSPIGFRFPNEPDLQRGWLNTLALGDTETGKSKVAKALRSLFNCGSFINGENCTFVGLVGGAIKQGSGQLMLRWGRIPLSDRQLVVIEELSGLSVEEIANMSDVRSSGIARLDKGGINSETNSRTRLLCLSNARSTKKSLSAYLFGVHAVQELIGHGEDIARFDLITTLTDREVSIDIINSSKLATIAKDDIIQPDQFQKLIHFIWALQPEQIQFTPSAYEECLNQTRRLSGIYHPSIPIFKGGSGRYKLGRIAASIACLQFSWNDGEGKVVVEPDHIRAATKLLELIYSKSSFGYRSYSKQMFDRDNVKDEILLKKALRNKIEKSILPKVIESLIHSTRFTRDELCAVAGTTLMHADQLIGTMLRERAIRKGDGNVWDITPAGKHFLETFLQRLQN